MPQGTFIYSGSDSLDLVGWYGENDSSHTQPVGLKKANGLDLYDMSGNGWEWCWDSYSADYYKNAPQENPRGPEKGSRVLRGGSWSYSTFNLRLSSRNWDDPYLRGYYYGFRLSQGAPSNGND